MNAEFKTFSLFDALRFRRSRRFCLGMELNGPLTFKSRFKPRPLSEGEEAALVFAAAGITGPVMADLSYQVKGGGNIMAGFAGRTIASGDAIQCVSLFVTNDSGTYLYRRPQDLETNDLREVAALAQRGELTESVTRTRVKLKSSRSKPSGEPLFNISANKWSAHAPGTSYFLPVNELTLMYINGLLEVLNEETGAYILDERASFQPAGLKKFAKSKGGHLCDNPTDGRVATIQLVERLVTEFVTVEQGMMLQNLSLMTEALGLGGYPNFANHDFGWCEALGFKMIPMPATQFLGIRGVAGLAVKLLGKDTPVPYPIALEHNGELLLRPFTPPYFSSMRHAVEAVVDYKFGAKGVYSEQNRQAWKSEVKVGASVPKVSEKAVAATIAYCEYIWERYGRFPVYMPPFRTVLGFQAGHLDLEFYEKYYRDGAVGAHHRADFASNPDPQ